MRELAELFWSFFKIGVFTFGGGYAMIPLIQREVTDRKGWVDEHEFLDLLTLAQSAPGPISLNTSVFVGYKMHGYTGAVAAILGIVVPSFVIILVVATLFANIRHNPVVDAAFKGMRPAVVALIIVPVITLARGLHWTMIFVIVATALAVWGLGWSPIYILIAAAVVGILWTLYTVKKSKAMIFLQLFLSYLKIGFFGFGGGYAMLSLIQNEVVVQHAWMTNAEFADIVAVSQITPGPIAINSATYVGYTVGTEAGGFWLGLLGSFIATFAVCLPALTLMLLITRFFLKIKDNKYVEGAMQGMRPAVIGMIAAAALLLIFPHGNDPDEKNFIDAWSWLLFAGVFVGAIKKVNPILLIVLSAVAGILIYYVF